MKKWIMAILILLSTTGCKDFDFDTMVCTLSSQKTSYEIKYRNEEIIGLSLVEEKDFTHLSEDNFDTLVEQLENLTDKRNEIEGINESMQVDGRWITITMDVDYEEYDVEADILNIFKSDLKKKDFDSISILREVLIQAGFTCDPVATNK